MMFTDVAVAFGMGAFLAWYFTAMYYENKDD